MLIKSEFYIKHPNIREITILGCFIKINKFLVNILHKTGDDLLLKKYRKKFVR